mgnify:FL=1
MIRNDRVRVLSDTAEHAEEIDSARAEQALKRAMDRLSHPEHTIETARALNALRRAEARSRLAKTRPI